MKLTETAKKEAKAVLIESDWNLKSLPPPFPVYNIRVLIESDWNLKLSESRPYAQI